MKQLKVISDAIEKFLNDQHNAEIFKYLYENEIKGWEKWLQIGLAYELKNIGKPELEAPFKYDKRFALPTKKAENANGFIDIQFLAKNHLQSRPTALELKIGQSNSALKKLLSDLEKIGVCIDRDWNFRAIYGVLIYINKKSKSTKFDQLHTELEKLGGKYLQHKSIKETDFSVIILGWERGRTANMSRSNYRKWLEKISCVYEDNKVVLRKSRSQDAVV